MATRTSRCISNSININNNNNSNNNNSTSSSSSLSPVSRRTTHTIPTPRNTCPRGTGLPTLQTGTSTPCQANLGRDWSQTVSSSFLSFFFSEVFLQWTHSNLSISDSPYGDVSGLPDPYTGHDISDELRQQSLDMHGLEHDLSATAPEGYTTPNRRVIREIIV